jgi:hypothetical protein
MKRLLTALKSPMAVYAVILAPMVLKVDLSGFKGDL